MELEQRAMDAQILEKNTRKYQLSSCLDRADAQFNSYWELNSDPVSGKEGVRRWKSSYLSETAQKELESNREFCLKRYSD